jgi:predicted DNA-binding WGR domain protein
MDHVPTARAALELRQIDHARRRARRYHLAEDLSLFGDCGLIVTWGRIGRTPRVRFEPFASPSELEARWHELLARRLAHGYHIHLPRAAVEQMSE